MLHTLEAEQPGLMDELLRVLADVDLIGTLDESEDRLVEIPESYLMELLEAKRQGKVYEDAYNALKSVGDIQEQVADWMVARINQLEKELAQLEKDAKLGAHVRKLPVGGVMERPKESLWKISHSAFIGAQHDSPDLALGMFLKTLDTFFPFNVQA